MMSEKYFCSRKILKHLGETLFSHSVEVTASLHFGDIFRIMSTVFRMSLFLVQNIMLSFTVFEEVRFFLVVFCFVFAGSFWS